MRTEAVTTLKRQATKLLADLHESKEPILITEHGQPSAYLLDVADYKLMVDRMIILEGIAKGEQAIREEVSTWFVAEKNICCKTCRAETSFWYR
ncbi:type II toxin-antitoxin system Phd/YefM family antitoxin [Alkalimarinus alittae]|uniref:Antitoxin n=1 Tax=Alkalimarinus alittae TaxID=2961619 RepID=A0ABY6N5Q6_9ALTE|nr:type II toxin-antitoxin system Phd/YefM family antitoxin [Alkalimarinus alittae]UZE97322.1 type II toxin-antitoxin system Phd/YefM family antitoxin [Alkalimarinus alittae]